MTDDIRERVAEICANKALNASDKLVAIVVMVTGETNPKQLLEMTSMPRATLYRSLSNAWEHEAENLTIPTGGNFGNCETQRENLSRPWEKEPQNEVGTVPALNTESPTEILLARKGGVGENRTHIGPESFARMAERLARLHATELGDHRQHLDTANSILATSIDLYGPDRVLVALKDIERSRSEGKRIQSIFRSFDAYCQRAQAPKTVEEIKQSDSKQAYLRELKAIVGSAVHV